MLTIKGEILIQLNKFEEALKMSRKGLKLIRGGSGTIAKSRTNGSLTGIRF